MGSSYLVSVRPVHFESVHFKNCVTKPIDRGGISVKARKLAKDSSKIGLVPGGSFNNSQKDIKCLKHFLIKRQLKTYGR